jgi:hypothetical protein
MDSAPVTTKDTYHHFAHLVAALVELEGRHGLDALGRRHILGLVHVHLGKGDAGIFVRHFFELWRNKLAGAACGYNNDYL